MPEFRLHSKFQPTGDQPAAIAQLTRGLKMGIREQTLLGVTGSGRLLLWRTSLLMFKSRL